VVSVISRLYSPLIVIEKELLEQIEPDPPPFSNPIDFFSRENEYCDKETLTGEILQDKNKAAICLFRKH
jgi:hypothetical protein